MRLAWLCQLLLGAGAVSALGKLEIGDTILGSAEGTVLRGRDITYPGQDKAVVSQRGSGDGASIHSASASMISVDLDPLNIGPVKNLTKPALNIQPRELARPNQQQPDNALPITSYRADANSHQATEPHHNPAPDPGQVAPRMVTTPKEDGTTRNPASANRAIAGMGAGLVSVMLVFFVFL